MRLASDMLEPEESIGPSFKVTMSSVMEAEGDYAPTSRRDTDGNSTTMTSPPNSGPSL